MRFLVLLAAAIATTVANAFPIGHPFPLPSQVYEYFNSVTGHYFYTLDPAEIAAIDAGAAGPGWSRTGLSFSAFASIAASTNETITVPCDRTSPPFQCVTVSRFIGTPGLGPNSHFLTANPVEVAALNAPGTGWTYETTAFAIPMPNPATGQCGNGLLPVYRAYNNRWMYNDSNHRYTASEVVRDRMRAEGWADEGIAFCAYSSGNSAVVQHSIAVGDKSGIQSLAGCNAPTPVPRGCIAVDGLAIPTAEFPGSVSLDDEFNAISGIARIGNPQVNANVAVEAGSRNAGAAGSFIQLSDWGNVFGMHMVTQPGAGNAFTSITPMVRLPVTAPAAGSPDARLFPFRTQYNTEYALRVDFNPGVNRLFVNEGGSAFGLAAIEFVDSRSGSHFRAHVLAYGTAPEGDFTGRDAIDGVIYVATSFKHSSPYGTNVGAQTEHMPADYRPLAPYLSGYAWSVHRRQFQAMVDSAHAWDPTLSTNPDDYMVGSFGVRNQMYGTGEMAGYLFNASISLMPL